MSIEYHFRMIDGRRYSWDVAPLRLLTSAGPVHSIPLGSIIEEFDSVYWFDEQSPPTCRAVVEQAQRIARADLSDPILMSADGHVIDGMHRLARAYLEGITRIDAITLLEYPEPDSVSDAVPGGGGARS